MEEMSMDQYPSRYAWAAGLLALLLIVGAGAVSYNVGLSQGLAQIGAGNATAPYPYDWHRHWGIGPFGPLLFIVFWIVILRGFFGLFWRPWRPWYYGGPSRERFEEWHRRAHERMNDTQ
jgi:hypothetical protein